MRHHTPKRRGGATLVFLIAMPLLLLALGMALYSSQLVEARVKLTNAADATALAAVQTLIDDDTLLEDRMVMHAIFDDARDEAKKYHDANPVKGPHADLDVNRANRPDGDVVIGSIFEPRGEFVPLKPGEGDSTPPHTANAVRVRLERTSQRGQPIHLGGLPGIGGVTEDMTRTVVAMLDRRVYGFAPAAGLDIPMIPIAVYSDPARGDDRCWEHQADPKMGSDRFGFDRERMAFSFDKPDRLPECRFHLGSPSDDHPPTACFLQLGTRDFDGVAGQIRHGIAEEHLSEFGGQVALGPDGYLVVPGTPYWDGSSDSALVTTLTELARTGEPRIWPLFRVYDAEGYVVVSGFVAARLVFAETAGGDLIFLLQPAAMSTVTALTDPEPGTPTVGPNRYLCKVRLAR